uniref:Poly [ADP-ribose] polymerase n=1 Tax=Anguilla anguilla TaxID=7936 RepID=A0A0E9XM90_ANGAN
MRKNNGGRNVSEKQLFHGTDSKHIDAICKQNFDWRICGTHGTAYGRGSYFARDAKYSHSYTGSSGMKAMFVCRVLVGCYTKGDSSYLRPPSRDGGDSVFYDSCVDNVHNPPFLSFSKSTRFTPSTSSSTVRMSGVPPPKRTSGPHQSQCIPRHRPMYRQDHIPRPAIPVHPPQIQRVHASLVNSIFCHFSIFNSRLKCVRGSPFLVHEVWSTSELLSCTISCSVFLFAAPLKCYIEIARRSRHKIHVLK